MRGEIAALVTAPLHKEALAAAGMPLSRATPNCCRPRPRRMLGAPCADVPVRMMLANDELRTVLVSIHMSLRDAIEAVTLRQRAADPAHHPPTRCAPSLGARAAHRRWPGLNPHAGEGGLFGREEIEIIAPAIAAARAEGIDAQRPVRARHRVHAGARQRQPASSTWWWRCTTTRA